MLLAYFYNIIPLSEVNYFLNIKKNPWENEADEKKNSWR